MMEDPDIADPYGAEDVSRYMKKLKKRSTQS